MRATVIIEKMGTENYRASASGKFGGGFRGAFAGETAEAAAAFAAREMLRYAQGNTEGGDLVAPPEVTDLVPEHLRSIRRR